MDTINRDLRRFPKLFLGLACLAFGIFLTKYSMLGMSPWGVLHDGISQQLGISFGKVSIFLGLIILVFTTLFLNAKVGFGTIFNILLIGQIIDFFEIVFEKELTTFGIQVIVLIIGVLFTTFGRSLYISSRLGPGPRDGLFVGVSRITGYQVKYVKPVIELTVLVIGFMLGGTTGVGTVVVVLVSGYLVQFFFKILRYDPHTSKQSCFTDYIKSRKVIKSN